MLDEGVVAVAARPGPVEDLSQRERRALAGDTAGGARRSTRAYPLTRVSRRCGFLHQRAGQPRLPHRTVRPPADYGGRSRLQAVPPGLVDRHPALRTTFTTRDGLPVQRVHPESAVPFARRRCGGVGARTAASGLDTASAPVRSRSRADLSASRSSPAQRDDTCCCSRSITSRWTPGRSRCSFVIRRALRRGEPASPRPGAATVSGIRTSWLAEPHARGIRGRPCSAATGTESSRATSPCSTYRPTGRVRRDPVFAARVCRSCSMQDSAGGLRELAAGRAARRRTWCCWPRIQVLLHGDAGQEEILVGSPVAGRARPEFDVHHRLLSSDTVVVRGRLAGGSHLPHVPGRDQRGQGHLRATRSTRTIRSRCW